MTPKKMIVEIWMNSKMIIIKESKE